MRTRDMTSGGEQPPDHKPGVWAASRGAIFVSRGDVTQEAQGAGDHRPGEAMGQTLQLVLIVQVLLLLQHTD